MPEVATTVRVRTIPIPTLFPVGPVNVHLIENDPITLVDTGPHTDEAWEALRDGLKTARQDKPRQVSAAIVGPGAGSGPIGF
jgi:glyoxylase-like metal-dependent hydrolase (beta-lactamase superfamily II)